MFGTPVHDGLDMVGVTCKSSRYGGCEVQVKRVAFFDARFQFVVEAFFVQSPPSTGGGVTSRRCVRWRVLSTEPVPVSAYVGSSKNLQDLKECTQVLRQTQRELSSS